MNDFSKHYLEAIGTHERLASHATGCGVRIELVGSLVRGKGWTEIFWGLNGYAQQIMKILMRKAMKGPPLSRDEKLRTPTWRETLYRKAFRVACLVNQPYCAARYSSSAAASSFRLASAAVGGPFLVPF
jgi:hypothetical protein